MRGSPLLRALLAFLAILALGWPLRRLTGDGPPAPVAATAQAPAPPAKTAEVELQLTFTTPPRSFSVRHLGKEIWTASGSDLTVGKKLSLSYPAEGIELQFAAEFPEGAPLTAARLVLTDPAGDPHEKSVWGTGRIDEVIAFP
jgi:hypothetical protein